MESRTASCLKLAYLARVMHAVGGMGNSGMTCCCITPLLHYAAHVLSASRDLRLTLRAAVLVCYFPTVNVVLRTVPCVRFISA